jgi:uncharacterized membrane protein YfcA
VTAELSAYAIAGLAVAAVISGAISGLLAGVFGIGGGAVLVPVFYQLLGALGVDEAVRMHVSVGTSLALIIPTSIRSFTAHRARGAVDDDLLRSMALPVVAGVILAAILAASISSAELRTIFALLTLVFGFRLILNRDSWRLGTVVPGGAWRLLIGAFIGFFSTLLGIGGGIMNNTFMTLYGRPLHQAVGTSSGIGVLIAIPGTIGYIWAGWGDPLLPVGSTGFVNWIAFAVILPVALLVTPWGVRIAHALPKRRLEIAFGLFCLFVALRFFLSLA